VATCLVLPGRRGLFAAAALAVAMALGACAPANQTADSRMRPARLTGKVWLVAEPPGRAPGSLYVFVSDGTLLMTSCVETYRLARWRAEADGRLVVTEDPATRYEVRVLEAGERELRLRLQLVNETVDLRLRAAAAPYVCPDLPR
jgi:hypothetical protein